MATFLYLFYYALIILISFLLLEGFPERVKYLYQGLLTVGHMRTTDEERQAALLYSDVERCLRGIPEGCLAFQVKVRIYGIND